ncbi:MAG TPA: nuclear transport factor 2 family protein [Propionibacteriaceae bacterium]
MDYEGVKSAILWNLTHSEPEASQVYTDDALLEFPQSGERFRGRENFNPWRGAYPVRTRFEVRSIRGEGDTWVVEGQAGYAEGDLLPFVDILHFRGDLIDRETIYMGGAFPAAEDRKRYAERSPLDTTFDLPVTVRGGG